MDLERYLIENPAPPAIPRRGEKRYIGYYVTQDEADMIDYVLHHPKMRAFKGHIQNLMRWIMYAWLEDLKDLVDKEELKPLHLEIVKSQEEANSQLMPKVIDKYLGDMGWNINKLWELGMQKEALEKYKEALRYTDGLSYPWNVAFDQEMQQHPAIRNFRKAVLKEDAEALHDAEVYGRRA